MSSPNEKKRKTWGKVIFGAVADLIRIWRENEQLLSRNTDDRTVGSLRDKKENYSTRRGLCVGTRFREFPQTLRGRGFSLLGFYSSFKYYVNVPVD